MTKLMAYVAFGGGCEPDPDSAAEELRRPVMKFLECRIGTRYWPIR